MQANRVLEGRRRVRPHTLRVRRKFGGYRLKRETSLERLKAEPSRPASTSYRIAELERRADHQDLLNEMVFRPMVSKMARVIEGVPNSVEAPAAASARYDLNLKLRQALSVSEKVIGEFDDLSARLSYYTDLQRQLAELVKLARARSNKDLRDALLTLHDASYSVYSENLTISQMELLCHWINQVHDGRVDRENVRNLDKALRDAGYETIPTDRFRFSQ